MKKLLARLCSRKADGEITMCIGVLVFVMIAVVAIDLATILVVRVEVNRYANNLIEVCADYGSFESENYLKTKQAMYDKFYGLSSGNLQITGITFQEYAPDGFFDDEEGSVQLGDEMVIRVVMNFRLKTLFSHIDSSFEIDRTRFSGQYFKREAEVETA